MNNYFIVHGYLVRPIQIGSNGYIDFIEGEGKQVYVPNNEEYDTVNKSMYLDDLCEIKQYANQVICFYADNDPYVKYETKRSLYIQSNRENFDAKGRTYK